MATTEIFKMKNPKSTCTAAALTWSYMLLAKTAIPTAKHFLPNNDTLGRNMRNIEDLDNDPEKQIAIMGFEKLVGQSGSKISSEDVTKAFKRHSPHVGIFWNSFHTVAYSYSHNNKQYFDNNTGLYRARKTRDIISKMEEVRKANSYGDWTGYIVLKLLKRFRM